MNNTEQEKAFLRGLYVEEEWIPKFTELFDKHFKKSGEETFVYLNAGSGGHAISLREKLDRDTQLFAVCENEELQKLAQAKAETLQADVDFSTSDPYFESDFVLADLSLVNPKMLTEFLSKAVDSSKNQVAFFLPTAGSFGEVFSYLWEVFVESELSEKTIEIEQLVTSLPTVSQVEEITKSLGLKKISTTTNNQSLDFENGKKFVNAPLVKKFLFPIWFDFLNRKEKEQVAKRLAQKIDDDLGQLTFRFSVKATIISGKKA